MFERRGKCSRGGDQPPPGTVLTRPQEPPSPEPHVPVPPAAAEASGVAEAGKEPESGSGYDLVASLLEHQRVIGFHEAQKLIQVARLYELDCMNPLGPSVAAQHRTAKAQRKQISPLTRQDLTVAEVA